MRPSSGAVVDFDTVQEGRRDWAPTGAGGDRRMIWAELTAMVTATMAPPPRQARAHNWRDCLDPLAVFDAIGWPVAATGNH
jgi:hypothetical protein